MRTHAILIAAGLLVAGLSLAPASAENELVPTTIPTPDELLGDQRMFVVGLTHEPALEVGDAFHGATVTSVNHAIDFVSVTTDDVAGFLLGAGADASVRYITKDSPVSLRSQAVPNDPRVGDQWGWNPSPGISAYNAWDVTTGTTGTVVAVVDTGLDKSHPDIGNYLQGWDFANGDSEPEDGSKCGHGTHVAGTVGALTNNGVGVAGTAQTTILPVKVLEFINMFYGCSGSFAAVANGITYAADQGADVINLSLGCAGCFDQATADAVVYAHNQGAFVAIATGNDAGPVGFPANVAQAVAVGAVDVAGNMYTYSNTGPEVDIVGPGVGVLSTYRGGYASLTGTSMATPHVAGTAALVLATGSYTNTQLENRLKSTASDLGHTSNQQGSGAVNACAAVGGTDCAGTPPPTGDDSVHTHDIDHSRQGSPRTGNALIQVWTFDDTESAEGGVTVSIEVVKSGGPTATGSAATGSDGSVTFQWSGVGGGTYTSCVTNLAKAGFTWDSAAGHAANGNCETESI